MATDSDIYAGAPGNVADGNWYKSGDYNVYGCIATASDSKTIRIDNYNNYGDSWVLYSFTGIASIPTYVTINSLTHWSYATRTTTGAGSMLAKWALGGAYTDGTAFTPTGGWYSDAMGRPGGGSWTRADLSSLQLKYYANGNATAGGKEISVDCMLVRVNWSYIAPATVQTDAATSVTSTTARMNGTLNPSGDAAGTYRLAYGTSTGNYSLSPNFSTVTSGSSHNPYLDLVDLTPGTTYYFRLEYKNSGGTQTNGSERTFTTTVSTKSIILITS